MRACLLLAIAACGRDVAPVVEHDAGPDSAVLPDSQPPPAGCDWGEQNDALNDITLGNGDAESTGLTLSTMLTFCGRVDTGHLIDAVVDTDGYRFALAERTPLRVDFAGDASPLATLDVSILDSGSSVVARGRHLGTHVAFETTLAPGEYRLVVTAGNATDLAAGFDYKLRAIANPPSCARVTATAAFVEAGDGPQDDRNDMIEIRYATGERTPTASTQDDPEDTTLVTAAGTDVRFTGTSANVDGADDFRDRDTYLVTTGTHDELAVRIDWTGDADFDVFVFPENATAEIGRGTRVGKTAPETAVFPVLANTRYWLWVGSYDSSAGLPVDYDVTLCPTQFAN